MSSVGACLAVPLLHCLKHAEYSIQIARGSRGAGLPHRRCVEGVSLECGIQRPCPAAASSDPCASRAAGGNRLVQDSSQTAFKTRLSRIPGCSILVACGHWSPTYSCSFDLNTSCPHQVHESCRKRTCCPAVALARTSSGLCTWSLPDEPPLRDNKRLESHICRIRQPRAIVMQAWKLTMLFDIA